MAFKLYAIFFATCVAAVRSLPMQHELPIPMSNQITSGIVTLPQMPFQPLQSPGVTVQSGELSYLAPEEKIIPFSKLDVLYKVAAFIAKTKLNSLKLLKHAITLLGKVSVVAVIAFSVAAVGLIITAIFCKKTGLCALQLHKVQLENEHIEAVRSLVTDDRMTTLTNFVTNAIEQYTKDA